jgi:hypothetical protein
MTPGVMATKGSNVTGDQERYDISTDGETWTATVPQFGRRYFLTGKTPFSRPYTGQHVTQRGCGVPGGAEPHPACRLLDCRI